MFKAKGDLLSYKLTYAEQVALSRTVEGLLYTCGSTLKGVQAEAQSQLEIPIVNALFERLHVRENVTCNDPVEIPYYYSERFQLICTHCACECDAVVEGQFPICDFCRQQGESPLF